jgi:predicted deacetylase
VSLNGRPAVAIALHDVEPRTFERCREIREWLDGHGINKITLLVIPAPAGRPFIHDAYGLASWLRERVWAGDCVAQHGLTHESLRRPRGPRGLLAHVQGGEAAEFPGRDPVATAESVRLGRRLLQEAGIGPLGFVAPGYAYTAALRSTARACFAWWADVRGVWLDGRRMRSPALSLGASTPVKRALSPSVVRAAGALPTGRLMRIDIHPADFDLPGHVAAIESLLQRAERRVPMTYDDLVA